MREEEVEVGSKDERIGVEVAFFKGTKVDQDGVNVLRWCSSCGSQRVI